MVDSSIIILVSGNLLGSHVMHADLERQSEPVGPALESFTMHHGVYGPAHPAQVRAGKGGVQRPCHCTVYNDIVRCNAEQWQ